MAGILSNNWVAQWDCLILLFHCSLQLENNKEAKMRLRKVKNSLSLAKNNDIHILGKMLIDRKLVAIYTE
jgi:hypothetical protein